MWKKNNEDFYQLKTRPAIKKGDTVYFVEKNRVSQVPSVKSEIKILLPIWPNIDSNRWEACGTGRSEWSIGMVSSFIRVLPKPHISLQIR